MGHSNWSSLEHEELTKTRLSTRGVSSFSHHDDISKGRVAPSLHDRLNVKGKIRESRDSVEHPESNAIVVMFDVTGSMAFIPRVLQEKLPKLMGALLRKSAIPHPQVLFMAVGDATCDRVPLQVGQFESGVEMDEDIDKFYLEGGGGGQMTESYELGMYFVANRTSIDCFEKRGKRGYLFIIGDEMAYSSVFKHHLEQHLGVKVQDDIKIEKVVEELKNKYEVFFILPNNAHHGGNKKVLEFWRIFFGQNVLELADEDLVCECIVSTIAANEGADVEETLDSLNLDSNSRAVVVKAVSNVAKSNANVTGDLVFSGTDTIERL